MLNIYLTVCSGEHVPSPPPYGIRLSGCGMGPYRRVYSPTRRGEDHFFKAAKEFLSSLTKFLRDCSLNFETRYQLSD